MVWLVNECTILSFMNWNIQDWSFRQGEGVEGGGGGSRMEGMLVVYGSGSLLAPKGKLFNSHLPELDEKFCALLV